jgi:regulator of cell morphogenesis and NO signaling
MDAVTPETRIPDTDADSGPERRTTPFVAGPRALVRDIVLNVPGASRAMERFRIDYCCGGEKTLEGICSETRVALADVLAALEEERAKGGETDSELLETPLVDLVRRIVTEHHARSRGDGARLVALSAEARDAHGADDPALAEIAAETKRLFGQLLPHLDEEEKHLFPYVEELERAGAEGRAAPVALFATIRHVVKDMEHEHERCEEAMTRLRTLGGDYAITERTPQPVRELYEALDAHEKDLIRHMHLEGNVVFPRAERLETKLRSVRRR